MLIKMSSNLRTSYSTSVFTLLAITLAADVTRSGGFEAPDIILMRGEVSDLYTSQNASYVELGNNVATLGEASDKSFSCMRILSEMTSILVTAFASITLANHWKKGSQSDKIEASERHAPTEVAQSEGGEQMPEILSSPGPSQAELEWVNKARAGTIRLTDDVFSAAMQWWLEQPLSHSLDFLAPKDQQLLKPVSELLQVGRQQEACTLLEQVGTLDRMERELQRTKTSIPPDIGGTSPLQRAPADPATEAGRLRRAIESYHVSPQRSDNSAARQIGRKAEESCRVVPIRPDSTALGVPPRGSASIVKIRRQVLSARTARRQANLQYASMGEFDLPQSSYHDNSDLFSDKCGCGLGA